MMEAIWKRKWGSVLLNPSFNLKNAVEPLIFTDLHCCQQREIDAVHSAGE